MTACDVDVDECPVDWCRHPHGPGGQCMYGVSEGRDPGSDRPCGCDPCGRCHGVGVIVVGTHGNQDRERQCPRCDGFGQR